MPVVQVNIWICECCGKTVTTSEVTSPYSDPVVALTTEEWEFIGEGTAEKLACPKCQQKFRQSPSDAAPPT
jgi:ribosomal protein L37AE/L43A